MKKLAILILLAAAAWAQTHVTQTECTALFNGSGGSGAGGTGNNTDFLNCITSSPGWSDGVNAQTGTTYTVLEEDAGKLVTLSNASAIAVTLPQAGTTGFEDGSWFPVSTIGAGTVTITPTTSTIDGAATLVLPQSRWAIFWSDGTNYFSVNNNLTTVEKIYFPAAGCVDGATAGLMWDALAAEDPAVACVNEASPTPDRVFAVAQFDDDQTYGIQTSFQLPNDWTGNVDLTAVWRATDVTGEVVWQSQTLCAAAAEATSGAWNSADAFAADTADGTADDVNTVTDTGITMTGCAASELFFLRFFRDPAHASDDLATSVDGVAELIGVTVTLRRAQ